MKRNYRIRGARIRKGLTIKQAAEQIGVSSSTLSRWEKQGVGLNSTQLIKFSKIYDTSLESLMPKEDKINLTKIHISVSK